MSDYAVDQARVYIAGFSAGGAMAAVMAATYPDLYAAAGIHSGLAQGRHTTSRRRSRRCRTAGLPGSTIDVPLIVFHGDRDSVVAPVNAEQTHRRLASRRPRASTAARACGASHDRR